MSVVADTSLLFASYDAGDPRHADAVAWLARTDEELVTTPLAIAELDRLVAEHGGPKAQAKAWRDLEVGAFTTRWWADALAETLRIARAHPALGLTGASLVALSERVRTTRIATFNPEFRTVKSASGEGFVLLPDDA